MTYKISIYVRKEKTRQTIANSIICFTYRERFLGRMRYVYYSTGIIINKKLSRNLIETILNEKRILDSPYQKFSNLLFSNQFFIKKEFLLKTEVPLPLSYQYDEI